VRIHFSVLRSRSDAVADLVPAPERQNDTAPAPIPFRWLLLYSAKFNHLYIWMRLRPRRQLVVLNTACFIYSCNLLIKYNILDRDFRYFSQF
jgi:hypothetical protein